MEKYIYRPVRFYLITFACFVVIAAIIVVVTNKEMFFETKHVGNLLEE